MTIDLKRDKLVHYASPSRNLIQPITSAELLKHRLSWTLERDAFRKLNEKESTDPIISPNFQKCGRKRRKRLRGDIKRMDSKESTKAQSEYERDSPTSSSSSSSSSQSSKTNGKKSLTPSELSSVDSPKPRAKVTFGKVSVLNSDISVEDGQIDDLVQDNSIEMDVTEEIPSDVLDETEPIDDFNEASSLGEDVFNLDLPGKLAQQSPPTQSSGYFVQDESSCNDNQNNLSNCGLTHDNKKTIDRNIFGALVNTFKSFDRSSDDDNNDGGMEKDDEDI